MNGFRRRYGASPRHLVLMLGSFALAGYAGLRLLSGDAWGIAVWFVGAAVLHDVVLLPLYGLADRAAQAVRGRIGRRDHGRGRGTSDSTPAEGSTTADTPGTPGDSGAPAARGAGRVNLVRVPAMVSGLLLLVWAPLVLGTSERYEKTTTLPGDVFLGRWLLISAGLFAISGAVFAVRQTLRRPFRKRRPRVRPAPPIPPAPPIRRAKPTPPASPEGKPEP